MEKRPESATDQTQSTTLVQRLTSSSFRVASGFLADGNRRDSDGTVDVVAADDSHAVACLADGDRGTDDRTADVAAGDNDVVVAGDTCDWEPSCGFVPDSDSIVDVVRDREWQHVCDYSAHGLHDGSAARCEALHEYYGTDHCVAGKTAGAFVVAVAVVAVAVVVVLCDQDVPAQDAVVLQIGIRAAVATALLTMSLVWTDSQHFAA